MKFFILLYLAIFVQHVYAVAHFPISNCEKNLLSKIEFLQNIHRAKRDVFVTQQNQKLKRGPQLASVVNLIQVLREMVGLSYLEDSQRMFDTLSDQLPNVFIEKTTPPLIHKAIKLLVKEYIGEEKKIIIESKVLDVFNPDRFSWGDIIPVREIEPYELYDNELRILFFGIIRPNGVMTEGHYVLVKKYKNGILDVIESTHPEIDMTFRVKNILLNSQHITFNLEPLSKHIFYEDYKIGYRYTVLSEHTIKLSE